MNDRTEGTGSAEKKPTETTPSGEVAFTGRTDAPGEQIIGRDIHIQGPTGIPFQEVEKLFVPLLAAVRQAPAEIRPQAEAVAEEMKKEVAKGDPQSDSRLAKLVDEMLGLVPQAASAIATIFTQPVLAGLAGPVTKFVLEKIMETLPTPSSSTPALDPQEAFRQSLLGLLGTLPAAQAEAIRLGAVPDWFDENLLALMAGSPAREVLPVQEVLRALESVHFIQSDPSGRYTIQPDIRAILFDALRRQEPERFLAANRAALDFFTERAVGAAPEEAPLLQRQIIYHQLILDEKKGLDLLCAGFEAAYERRQLGAAEDLLIQVSGLSGILSEEARAWLKYFYARLDLAVRRGDSGTAVFTDLADSAPGRLLNALAGWSLGQIQLADRQWTAAIQRFKRALAVVRSERSGLYAARVQLSIGNAYLDLAENSGGLQPESGQPRRGLKRLYDILVNLPFFLVEWLLHRVGWLPDGWYAGTNYQDWIILYLLDQAGAWFRRARDQFRHDQESQGLVEALLPLARIECLKNRWSRAAKNYQALLHLESIAASPYRTARVLLGQAELLNKRGEAAVEPARQALDTFQRYRNRSLAAAAAFELGKAHARLGNQEEAAQALLNSLDMYRETGEVLKRTAVTWMVERLARDPGLSPATRQLAGEAARQETSRAYLARFSLRLLVWFRRMALFGALPFSYLLVLITGVALLRGISLIEYALFGPAYSPTPGLAQVSVVLSILAFTLLFLLIEFWFYRLVYSLIGLSMVHFIGRRVEDIERGQPVLIETHPDRLEIGARNAPAARARAWEEVNLMARVNYSLWNRPVRLISRLLLNSRPPLDGSLDRQDQWVSLEGITHGYDHLQADITDRLNLATPRLALNFTILGTRWMLLALLVSIGYALIVSPGWDFHMRGSKQFFTPLFLFTYVTMLFVYPLITLWRLAAYRARLERILGPRVDGWPAWVFWLAAVVSTIFTLAVLVLFMLLV